MFLLFLGHHQGDNRYKKWIKHLYTGWFMTCRHCCRIWVPRSLW
jgi:hypothetical protein